MSSDHSYQIEKLKNNFDNIIVLKSEIVKIKFQLAEKLNQLKVIYNELAKVNTKKILLFCLDSFYFQYRTFTIEMENIDRFRILMNNRMYCDYYKLHSLIITHIKENVPEINTDEIEKKSYPVYKDLEPFQEYKLDDIKDIHTNILSLVNNLYSQIIKKKYNIDHYNEKHQIGFSISNFINTLDYENRLMNEQVSLYVNYLSFFHISQKKQLTRLFAKISEFLKEVNENISINKTFSIKDVEEEQNMNKFYVIDQDLAFNNTMEDSDLLNSAFKMTQENIVLKTEDILPVAQFSENLLQIDDIQGEPQDFIQQIEENATSEISP